MSGVAKFTAMTAHVECVQPRIFEVNEGVGRGVEEARIVAHRQHGALPFLLQVLLQPDLRVQIEVVRRFCTQRLC